MAMFTARTTRKHRSGIWNRKRIEGALRRIIRKPERVEYNLTIFLPEGVYQDLRIEDLNAAICKGIRSLPEVGYKNVCATELVDKQNDTRSGKTE